jgi:hypothetical protein
MRSYYNPYRVLLNIYEERKENDKMLELLRQLAVLYPGDPGIKERIDAVQAEMKSHADTTSRPAR